MNWNAFYKKLKYGITVNVYLQLHLLIYIDFRYECSIITCLICKSKKCTYYYGSELFKKGYKNEKSSHGCFIILGLRGTETKERQICKWDKRIKKKKKGLNNNIIVLQHFNST